MDEGCPCLTPFQFADIFLENTGVIGFLQKKSISRPFEREGPRRAGRTALRREGHRAAAGPRDLRVTHVCQTFSRGLPFTQVKSGHGPK